MKNRTPPRDTPPPPAFEAAPRKCNRHDGWTPERQRAFIAALADTGSVTRAAAGVNMSTESAYALRRQPGAEGFRRAWEAALDFGVSRLKDIILERAIEGQVVPVIAGGKLHGYRRVKNDRLLMFAIRMNDRGADGARLSAHQFTPRAGDNTPAASLTHTLPSQAEAQDANAARIEAFAPVPLSPLQQAEVYEALAAEARRQAELTPDEDPAEPLGRDMPPGTLLASPHENPPERWRIDERPWYRLHDEEGAKAIEAALAEIEANKLRPEPAEGAARLLEPPHPSPSGEKKEAAAQGSKYEGDPEEDKEDRPPAIAAPLSPKTGKPPRPYKKRVPKPRFENPFEYRNYKD